MARLIDGIALRCVLCRRLVFEGDTWLKVCEISSSAREGSREREAALRANEEIRMI